MTTAVTGADVALRSLNSGLTAESKNFERQPPLTASLPRHQPQQCWSGMSDDDPETRAVAVAECRLPQSQRPQRRPHQDCECRSCRACCIIDSLPGHTVGVAQCPSPCQRNVRFSCQGRNPASLSAGQGVDGFLFSLWDLGPAVAGILLMNSR